MGTGELKHVIRGNQSLNWKVERFWKVPNGNFRTKKTYIQTENSINGFKKIRHRWRKKLVNYNIDHNKMKMEKRQNTGKHVRYSEFSKKSLTNTAGMLQEKENGSKAIFENWLVF